MDRSPRKLATRLRPQSGAWHLRRRRSNNPTNSHSNLFANSGNPSVGRCASPLTGAVGHLWEVDRPWQFLANGELPHAVDAFCTPRHCISRTAWRTFWDFAPEFPGTTLPSGKALDPS